MAVSLFMAFTSVGWSMTDLRVSRDGHRLERRDGTPFLLLSDTQWLLNTYGDADVAEILDNRAAKGFTAVQVFATHAFHGTPTLADFAGRLPFVGNDPTQLDAPYWQRWRWICDQAAGRGLHFILVMGEPGRTGDVHVPWRVQTHEQAYEYGRQVGLVFASAPNVVFAQGQDSQADGSMMPSVGPCLNADGWRAMAKGTADGVNGVNDRKGVTDYTTSLMTYHGLERYPGGYTDDMSRCFQDDDWIDFYGPEIWHDHAYVHEIVSRDWHLDAPVKPSFAMEGTYEGEAFRGTGAPVSASYVRVEAWHSLLGGGCGYAYGHCRNWQQSGNTEHLDAAGARHMAQLAAFAGQHAWWRWLPDAGLVAATGGTGVPRQVGVRSTAGDECVVYFPDRTVATVRNVLAAAATATWFDPRDGTLRKAGVFASGQSRDMMPPGGWEDAVLVLIGGDDVVAVKDGGGA